MFANGEAAAVRHAGRVVEKVLNCPPLICFDDRLPPPEDELPVLILDEVVSQGLTARFPGLLPTSVLRGVDRVARIARVPQDAEHRRGRPGLVIGHRARLLALSLPSSIAFEDDRPTVQGHAWNPSRLAVGLSTTEGTCDSVQRVPSKEGSVDGTHSLSLVRDELASGGIAHRTNPFGWPPLPGTLDVRPRLASALALDLRSRDRSRDAGVHAPAVGAEVSVAIGCHEEEATGLGSVDPVFKFPRLSGEPVEIVAHDRIK